MDKRKDADHSPQNGVEKPEKILFLRYFPPFLPQKNTSKKTKKSAKNGGFIAYSAIKMPTKPPYHNPLRTSAKLSPVIGKILL